MTATTLPRKVAGFTPGMLGWLAFLGLCLLIGLVSAYLVLTRSLIVTNMSNTVPWGL